MARVAVVTDSTADLPAEVVEELGIHVIPLNVRIGGTSYEDRVTISPSEFMRSLVTTNGFPTTSQPSVGRFQNLYSQIAQTHDRIVSIHISSRLSGTYQSAYMAREMMLFGPDVRVIDSASASMGLGFLVERAAQMAREGRSLDEIESAITGIRPRVHVAFLVDTLEYLRRGGRIGRAAEIVGSILQLKPILRIEEGIVVPHARTRTRARAIAGLIELVSELPSVKSLALMYTAGTDDIDAIADHLTSRTHYAPMIISEMSPALSAHIGPRGLGVAILEDEPS